ncbi:MAG TPA: PEGA domain-containing protein [Kofleriaceae bacterium]|nr:PEGA domain-containing protein [Kofleriaceae bacterium]
MRRLTAIAALLLAASAPAAVAQPKPAAGRAEAEQFFRAGERAFKNNSFQSAAEMFERAYASLPLPAIAFSAAQAYRLQYALDGDPSKLKRAVTLYETYVSQEPKGKRVGDAAKILAELRPRLEELEKKGKVEDMPVKSDATTLMVTTTTDVAGASLAIDGGKPEALHAMREIAPGRHKVVVTAPGYFPAERSKEVLAGVPNVVEIELEPRPAVVNVRAADGAQVSVNGRPAGVTPLVRPIELPPGKHLVTITRRGHRPWSREIRVVRGQSLQLAPSFDRTGQRRLAYGVLGVSGALLVGAGVTFGMSIAAASDANDLNEKREAEGLTVAEREDYQDALDRRDARRTTTWILLGSSAAVATAGFLLYFMDNPRAEVDTASPGLTVSASAGGDSLGLALGGRF